MTQKLTPDDFKPHVDIILHEAHRLMHEMRKDIDVSYIFNKRRQDFIWLMPLDSFKRLRASMNGMVVSATTPDTNRREMMGLPIRITYDDPEGTPMLQLVMEPGVRRKR